MKLSSRLWALFAILFCVASVVRGASGGSVSGIVKDGSGHPMSGAYVKLTHADRGLVFMVISQGDGRFRAANLPPGKYGVEGIAGGFETNAPVAVEVSDTNVSVNLSLTAPQPDYPGNSLYQKWLTDDGPGKSLVMTKCTACHDVGWALRRRLGHEAWSRVVNEMQGNMQMKEGFTPITEEEKGIIIDYLTRNVGLNVPADDALTPGPNSNLSRTPLTSAAAKYLVMEYHLPDAVLPHDVAVDSKGVAWLGERNLGNIGRFDPDSLTYTRIPLPPMPAIPHRAKDTEPNERPFVNADFDVNGMAADPQDRLWTADGRHKMLIMYDPANNKFALYPIPYGGENASANTIRFHPDGTIWVTEVGQNQVFHFFPDTKQFNFIIPPGKNSRPYGEAIDGRGTVWFAENGLPKIASIDPETEKLTEYDVPSPKMNYARRMDTDADGNVWFGYFLAGALVKIDVRTGKMTPYYIPTLFSGPYSISIDKVHNIIWFSEEMANKIGRFDPKTNKFVEFDLPSVTDTRRIEVDRSHPNRVWYCGSGADGEAPGGYPKVGYVEFLE